MNYPVERDKMPPVPVRTQPEAYAQPHHRPQGGMSEQERLHLSQLLSRAETILAIQEEHQQKHDLDKLAEIIYDLPYRHTIEMAKAVTKIEGAEKIGTPDNVAAILFAWAVGQRGTPGDSR